jgi:hypothetical protein
MRIPTRIDSVFNSLNQLAITDMKTLMLRHVPMSTAINVKLQDKFAPTWFEWLDENRQS